MKTMAREKGFKITGKDWWDSEGANEFMLERQRNQYFDKEVDRRLIKIADSGNVVITSYTLPWLTDSAVKIWLRGSQYSRAKRMANRDGLKVSDAEKIVRQRDNDNKGIYWNLYNFGFGDDLSVFDFILNTDLLDLQILIDLTKKIVGHILVE